MSSLGNDWQKAANRPTLAEAEPTPWFFAYVGALVSVVAVYLAFTSEDVIYALTKEAGPIELASAMLWGLAAVTLLSFSTYGQLRQRWHLAVGFALLGARELDWDKAFTAEGVLQLRLYSGDSPWFDKLVGLCVLALIGAVVWKTLRSLPQFLRALRVDHAGWAIAVVASILLGGVAKTIDGIGRKLAEFGILISSEAGLQFAIAEELMELIFVFGMILALCLYEARARQDRDA